MRLLPSVVSLPTATLMGCVYGCLLWRARVCNGADLSQHDKIGLQVWNNLKKFCAGKVGCVHLACCAVSCYRITSAFVSCVAATCGGRVQ